MLLLQHLLAHSSCHRLYSKLSYTYVQCTFYDFYSETIFFLCMLFYRQTVRSYIVIKNKAFGNYALFCTFATLASQLFVFHIFTYIFLCANIFVLNAANSIMPINLLFILSYWHSSLFIHTQSCRCPLNIHLS